MAQQARKRASRHSLRRADKHKGRGKYARQFLRTAANKKRALARHVQRHPNDKPARSR